MKKITATLLFLFIIFSSIEAQLELSTQDVKNISMGVKRSEVEKILLKKASQTGLSFNFEDYREADLNKVNYPGEDIHIIPPGTKAYIMGGSHFVFVDDILKAASVEVIDPKNLPSLIPYLISQHGEEEASHEDPAFLVTPHGDLYIFKYRKYEAISRDIISDDSWKQIQRELDNYREYKATKSSHQRDHSDEEYEEVREHEIVEEVADSTYVIEEYDSNIPHIPIDKIEKILPGLSQSQIEQILDIDLDDYKSFTIGASDDKDEEMLVYNYHNLALTFIGNKLNRAYYHLAEDSEEYLNILSMLNDKFGMPHSSNIIHQQIWLNDKFVITINNKYSFEKWLEVKDFRNSADESLDKVKASLGEPIYPITIHDIASIKIQDSKNDIIRILKKSTQNKNFDLNKCRVTDTKSLAFFDSLQNIENSEFFIWNDLALVFSDNKLVTLYYIFTSKDIIDKDVIKTEIMQNLNISKLTIEDDNTLFINNKDYVFIYRKEPSFPLQYTYSLIWKPWLPSTQRAELGEALDDFTSSLAE